MPYDLFISYAHRDNARGQVRELRDAISEDFEKFAGRNLTIFFDEHDIPSMADWEKRIAQGLRESRLFLAVLSPNYFASAYCRREWEEYVRYEAMRQCLGAGVEQSIAAAVDEMRKRQWCDLASQKPVKIVPWNDAGKRALEDAEVARRLNVLKEQMAERLKRADRAQQSPTNLYRHNPQFVGRVRELTLLREALNERGSVGVVGHKTQTSGGATAVHGLGGMGKTELALAYAHAFAWDYPGGRWLARCEGLDNFDLVLRQLAEPLHVEFTEDEKKDAHRAGERILAELRRREHSLLLLDNVTHAELLGPDVLMRLPPQGHVHLLATTRLGPAQLAGSPHDHTFVAVDELPAADALALIRAHQPDARFASPADETAACELVKLLKGFTLAVETAAIYLSKHAASGEIAAYTARLSREVLATSEGFAADAGVGVRHKEKLLERTLAITFETLNAEQLYVLTLAALLPADQVALPWLRTLASENFPSVQSDAGAVADIAWQQLANSLLSLRLLQLAGVTDADGRPLVVRMHRLVQELRRNNDANAAATLEPVLLAHIKLRAELLWNGWVEHEHRWELAPLTACAWQWMERANDEGCLIANRVGKPLQHLGQFTEKERLARRMIEKTREIFGEDHPNHAAALGSLAEVLKATGRFADAEPLLHRQLAIVEGSFGTEDPHVASAMSGLAQLLQATNRLNEAEQLFRSALAIDERTFGPVHGDVGRDLHNLGSLLNDTKRYAESEPLLRRALAITEAAFGGNHPDLALALNSLAQSLQATNRLIEAEQLFRRALAIEQDSLNPDNPQIATRLNNLGVLLQATNRPAEAESHFRKALEIWERSLGFNHPNIASCLASLAELLRQTNRITEAVSLYHRALAILENGVCADPLKVAIVLNNLAELLIATDRFAESESLLRRALSINEGTLGPDHPETANVLANLASLLERENRLAEAELFYRRSLAIWEKKEDHPNVAVMLNKLVKVLYVTGRFAEAEPLIRGAIALDTASFGANHPKVAAGLNNLAQLLQVTNRLDEAETNYRRALAINEASFGLDHPEVATSLNNLAGLLDSTGRLTEAENLYRRALSICEATFGPDHSNVATPLNNLAVLLRATNRFAESEQLSRRVIEIFLKCSRSTGYTHPNLGAAAGNHAELLAQIGHSPEQVLTKLNDIGHAFGVSFGH